MSDSEQKALDLNVEIAALRKEVARLNGHRFIRVQNSLPALLAFQFARGAAFGLGALIGASLLLSVLAWSLSQVDFVPVLGDWAGRVAAEIEAQLDAAR